MNFTSENWSVVESFPHPVVVDFWASWCGPCRKLAPVIDELANEYGDRVLIGKVNVDECADIAAKYGVMGLPTVIIFKGGQPVELLVGTVTKRDLTAKIDAVV